MYPPKDQKYPRLTLKRGEHAVNFFQFRACQSDKKTFLQSFMRKHFNNSLTAPSRRGHAVKRFFKRVDHQ